MIAGRDNAFRHIVLIYTAIKGYALIPTNADLCLSTSSYHLDLFVKGRVFEK